MTLTRMVVVIAAMVLVSCVGTARASLVGVDFSDSTPLTPTNWTSVQATPLAPSFTLTNLIDETGSTTPIDLAVEFNFFPNQIGDVGHTPEPTQIPIHTQSLAGIDDAVTMVGDAVYTWRDLTPGAAYDVFFFGIARFLTQDVTITGAGTPIAFSQTDLPGNVDDLYINSELGDSSRTLDSYALTVIATGAGEIEIATIGGPSQNESFSSGLAIRPIPEPTTAVLLGLGSLTLLSRRRRQRRLY